MKTRPALSRREIVRDLVLLALFLAAIAAVAFAPVAFSQDDGPTRCPRRSDELILGALTWHEAGLYSDGDLRGIHAVISTIARNAGTSFADAACSHSRRLLTGRTARPWASDLDEAGTEPARWPTTIVVCEGELCEVRPHPPWSNFRDRWLALLDRAREVLAGPPACHDALTWGGRLDFSDGRRRALSGTRTWVDSSCDLGETRNRFGRWE